MGPGMGLGGYRYSPPPDPPGPHPPRVHLHPTLLHAEADTALYPGLNMVVGLKTVGQLTLSVHFSGFRGITEVYNLSKAGNPNNH